jgi:hypothetical protein
MSTWQVHTSAGRRVLEVDSDAMSHVVFTFEKRGGADYVVAVELPWCQSCRPR